MSSCLYQDTPSFVRSTILNLQLEKILVCLSGTMLSRVQTASLIVLGFALGLIFASKTFNLLATYNQAVNPAFQTQREY